MGPFVAAFGRFFVALLESTSKKRKFKSLLMPRLIDLPSATIGALFGAVAYHLVRKHLDSQLEKTNGEESKNSTREKDESQTDTVDSKFAHSPSKANQQEQNASRPAIAGMHRATRHSYKLPCQGDLPELQLDIMVAKPPCRYLSDGPPIILYVLDPDPLLFGAAALFAYAQAGYYASNTTHSESVYRRMIVVGVGHSAETISLDSEGFDAPTLRNMRRRDFPPQMHPTLDASRGPNAHAARFADGLCDAVIPFVESKLLDLPPGASPPRRALLGASYSGSLQLQAMMRRPTMFTDFIMGSPSVCFDPEIFNDIQVGDWAGPAVEKGVGAIIILGRKERKGKAVLGNVHDEMTPGCKVLADKLRERGLLVEGINEVPAEDHGTVKMPLVSQGMTWLTDRVMGVARRRSVGEAIPLPAEMSSSLN